MGRRTHVEDYEKIGKADDLDQLVRDKRSGKRATKQKAKRRNRHYAKTLLKHLQSDVDENDV
jgi:uncharacterized protein (DUF2336 family)